MTDLLTRLRQMARAEHSDLSIADEAAEEILGLQYEREQLRRACRVAVLALAHAAREHGDLYQPAYEQVERSLYGYHAEQP